MKKALLFSGMLATALSLNAQQRLVLYEEFSGENCAPCAAFNPGLWSLLSNNTDDVILIKYQSPIPTAGPIFYQNPTDVEARRNYYRVTSAPFGLTDGKNGDNINRLTQAKLDAAIAAPTNFTVTVSTPAFTAATNEISSEITIEATAAYTGSNLKLRAALVESLHYDTPPGNNGEVDFHNVMRKMYPSADGQAIENNWTAGQSETYTVSGSMTDYVDKNNDVIFLLVWIQEDGSPNNKSVLQAAKSEIIDIPVPNDVASDNTEIDKNLVCLPDAVTPTITLTNTGSDPLTSAKVYYAVEGESWEEYDWSGNLAAGASEEVALPSLSLANMSGFLNIKDSVALPNTVADINLFNNVQLSAFSVVNPENVHTLPIVSGFEEEGEYLSNWVPFGEASANPLIRYSMQVSQTAYAGYDASKFAMGYPNFSFVPGSVGGLIFPVAELPSGPKALDFYVAYAQWNASSNDKLQVVYSVDCGENWTTVWEKAGADLSTASPLSGSAFIPVNNGQWRFESIDLSDVPEGKTLVALRLTSGGGNYLFIDNVTLRTGEPNSIAEVMLEDALRIYPNPVTTDLTLEVVMKQTTAANLNIVNLLGQTVKSQKVQLEAGQHNVRVSTADLAAGVYILNIETKAGSIQQKFVKK